MAKLVQAATILEVKDIRRSEAFYRQRLRFRPEHPAPLNQYWAMYLYVDDVDAMAQELLARGVTLEREPEDQPYGCRDFDIRDPDGHLIGIGQNEQSAAGQLTLPHPD